MNKYLLLCLLPLAACQKETEDIPQDKSLIPLAIGNTWTYDNKAYNADGSYCCSEQNTTWKVYGKSSREGFFILDESGEEQLFSSAEKIINYLPEEGGSELEFRKVNKIDTFDIHNYDDGYKLVSVAFPGNYLIETHNCLMNEYLMYDDQGNLYSKDVHYVEPGLGYIRMEYYYADENGDLKLDMREDLLSYELKN